MFWPQSYTVIGCNGCCFVILRHHSCGSDLKLNCVDDSVILATCAAVAPQLSIICFLFIYSPSPPDMHEFGKLPWGC